MKYRVTHETRYESKQKVSMGRNQVYLTPRTTDWQTCQHSRVTPTPAATYEDKRDDYFGNTVHLYCFERGYQKLEIRSNSQVTVQPRQYPEPEKSPTAAKLLELLASDPKTYYPVLEMTVASPLVTAPGSEIRDYAAASFPAERPLLIGLRDLLARFEADFEFDTTATNVNTPINEVMQLKRGVCQDFAHLLVAMLRSLKLPARYVSGYLRTYPAPGQPRLRGADASHAWVGVYCGPELGWVDIDPTNNCFVSDEHITVAWGRDYADVAPVRGVVVGAGAHTLTVSVDVEPQAATANAAS